MLSIFKYLKRHAWLLPLVILLLGAQALLDLTIPSYSAAIVNIGIEQQGVQFTTPLVLRESTLNTLLREDNEAEQIRKHYHPATPEDLKKLWIAEENEPLLVLKPLTALEQKNLDSHFDRLFLPHLLQEGSLPPPAATASMLETQTLPEGALVQMIRQKIAEEYQTIGMNIRQLQQKSIWQNGGQMLILTLLSALTAALVGLLGARLSARLGSNLRLEVFSRVVSFGQEEMDSFSTASLITRSTNDIQQVQTVMVFLMRTVIYAPILGIGGIFRAMSTNPSMTWIIFVSVLTVIAIVSVLTSVAMPRFKAMQTLMDKVNQVVREILTGLPVIRAFCTQQQEEKRFDEANTRLKKNQLFVHRLMSGMMPLMMLVMNATSVLVLWVGAHNMAAGTMQLGDIMAFIQYAMQIISAFLMISMMSVMLPRAAVSAKRILEVLNTSVRVTDPQAPVSFEEGKQGLVEFRNVRFRYPGAAEDMLSDITFTARPGQVTAILGGTGSGKSTLIRLIPRFFDVSEGEVFVDGADVRTVSMEALRKRIGYVPQKAVLFSGTVKENLSYGCENVPMERIEKAARIAQAEAFVAERETGYESEISQGGANLSGGQKQRLSIARAIVKDPEIYIFDDSFSALDFKTDKAVRSALKAATENTTVLIVAQRISTVMHADQILVLEDGKPAGIGTHRELMETCEVYRQIATSQLSKEELDRAK